jgi:hypothetical protein
MRAWVLPRRAVPITTHPTDGERLTAERIGCVTCVIASGLRPLREATVEACRQKLLITS